MVDVTKVQPDPEHNSTMAGHCVVGVPPVYQPTPAHMSNRFVLGYLWAVQYVYAKRLSNKTKKSSIWYTVPVTRKLQVQKQYHFHNEYYPEISRKSTLLYYNCTTV